jgi:YidC/Oxa1 family membrane protein insertase
MENQKSILIFAFAVVSYFLFLAWQEDYSQQPTQTQKVEEAQESIPTFIDEIPAVESAVPEESLEKQPEAIPEEMQQTAPSAELITVTTDVLEIKIDPRGGDIVESSLIKYPLIKGQTEPVHLLKRNSQRTYVAQSGLLGKNTPDGSNKKALFKTTSKKVKLASGEEIVEVLLTWTNPDGIIFNKTWRLKRGSYLVDLDYQVINHSGEKLNTKLYTQLMRDQLGVETKQEGLGMRAYLGTAYSTDQELYNKYDFDEIVDDKLSVQTQGGWVAILQHYFLSAWIPTQDQSNKIYSLTLGDKIVIGTIQSKVDSVAPGTEKNFKAGLYMGPKIQKNLAKIAKGLDLTVDYGVLWWIGQPIFAVLSFLHGIVGNWGFAIILVTFVVKLFLYPLSNAQYRSFGKMRRIQPKMAALKERYGDDRQKMGQETMKMYKKEGVNPLGGCLPLLVQMPVFFALYWVLMESVEMRQAPFIWWIDDLSLKDPLYILPLIMGASMWLMQKMQPTAANMDPMQQKIMQFMPVMMTAFFFFFPSGLVLYWVVNNLLSISQQTYVTKKMEREELKKQKVKSKNKT